uniref:Uncharacterized protein n=1 Tax=Romanomermis culicivorax TaxID=13658 RepID=A0A915J7C8_ROMCU
MTIWKQGNSWYRSQSRSQKTAGIEV